MTHQTRPLRRALIANAAFSASCATALLAAPEPVVAWLGLGPPLLLAAVGVGLLAFAADLLHQATRPRLLTWRALYASLADLLWVIATATLLLIAPNLVSEAGAILLLAVAAVVLAFGIWQLLGIDRAHRAANPSRYRHCVQVAVDVPAAAMWNVISELGEIERYMPSLRSSEVLGRQPDGVGAVRVCENHAGKRWGEECTRFEDGRGFDVRFLAEDPDFPFPATIMFGGWEVIPRGEGSEVRVWWELEPKPKLLAPVILPILALGVDRDFPGIIKRMATAAMGDGPLTSKAAQRMSRTGLSPYPC
ncbi:MAG: SRPBCC family protein [Gammaproteobacteria bacterium]|nr:SRPBCC family protein [Gammaproteobacteria bacterium]